MFITFVVIERRFHKCLITFVVIEGRSHKCLITFVVIEGRLHKYLITCVQHEGVRQQKRCLFGCRYKGRLTRIGCGCISSCKP